MLVSHKTGTQPVYKKMSIYLYQDLDKEDSSPESTPPVIVKAHGNDIVCAAISQSGDAIATASSQVLYCALQSYNVSKTGL